MATTLTLSAASGAITSSIGTSDANADTIITTFLKAYNDADVVDGWTNQEKADAFMAQLKDYILDVHNAKKHGDARRTADSGVVDDDWATP